MFRSSSSMFHGAVAGALGVILVMPFFFPLGRAFDPSIGGDTAISLLSELVLGLIGGLVLSPFAAAVGAVVGWRLNGRQVSPGLAVVLIAVASLGAVTIFAVLNGGIFDEVGSTRSLRFTAALGAFAGAAAVVAHWSTRLAGRLLETRA